MGAQELNHGLQILQQNNGSWEAFGGDIEEADEETLSLCDLVMSSDANEYWNNHDHESSNSSSSSSSNHHHDQDFFEFFSDQDFSASSASAAAYSGNNNNIIFCGKLIPNKDQKQIPFIEEKPLKQENGNNQKKNNNDVNSSSCIFPWKNLSQHAFNKSRTFPPPSSSSSSKGKSLNKSFSLPVVGKNKKLGDEKFDFSVKKVSVLATPVKSRWYLFAFGVGRFPMEIELKDMKMRQSRKNKAVKVQQNAGGEPENLKSNKEQRRSGKSLWRLLKVLGCKNKLTNSVM